MGVVLLVFTLMAPLRSYAQDDQGQFSIQVSPSPLVATVKPGIVSTLDLTVRNNNTRTEDLRMSLRAFSINDTTGQVDLADTEPSEVQDWVTFSQPTFSLQPSEFLQQKITIAVPADAGFSYSFAVLISREDDNPPTAGAQLKASVAVFTLLSVDRPGAKRSFEVLEFKTPKRMYEYLPASFEIRLKNTGNTIVQPFGTIYVQRSANSNEPITTLPLNSAGSYVLPDTTRQLQAEWNDGFPRYENKKAADNVPETRVLTWDWSKAQQFRFGKYTAKVVAVYNDGQRDVPIEAVVSFWVIPWKLLIILALVGALVVIGLLVIVKRVVRPLTRRKSKHEKTAQPSES
jgi:hypothetical protein